MARIDLAARSRAAEMMDAPDIGYAAMESCLRDLERVNRATLAYRPVLGWLAGMMAAMPKPGRPLRILDIASGGGDTVRQIWRWAARRGIEVALTGLDINAHAQQIAEARTQAGAPVTWRAADIFSYEPLEPFDFIVTSLFTHHLAEEEIVRLLRWMDGHANEGWLINDLHRHAVPYHFIRHATAQLRLDPMVRHDAPVSVARGFTAGEWKGLLNQAAIDPARRAVRWHFPFRYVVSCKAG